jgi:hypothetical protein
VVCVYYLVAAVDGLNACLRARATSHPPLDFKEVSEFKNKEISEINTRH